MEQRSFLKSCGSGGGGTLLTGDEKDYNTFQDNLCDILLDSLSIGSNFGYAIAQGQVWRWGSGCLAMTPLPTPEAILEIACGWTHSLFRSASAVFSIGSGSQGQLGLGSLKETSGLVRLELIRPKLVACGFRTSFIATFEGELWCFGENRKGQLGLGHTRNTAMPEKNPYLLNINLVKSGNRHSAATTSDGLYTWGSNSYGQLGLPELTETLVPRLAYPGIRAAQLELGWFHTAVLADDGRLHMAGRADLGQLGKPDCMKSMEFEQVLGGVQAISSGSEHILAQTTQGVLGWGWNEHGNLGLGDYTNRYSPIMLIEGQTKLVKAFSACSFVLL